MSKVTVLMAVYNAAQFLHESLDSLRRQTLADFQAVCIDDCSTDDSLSILRDYAARDERFRVIALGENHGQAYARNQGMMVADGQFVTMLDADDWLADDALEQAVSTVEQHPLTDCVLFDLRKVFPDGNEEGYSWHYDTSRCHPETDGSFTMMTGRQAFIESIGWGIHGVYLARRELFDRFPYDDSCRAYADDNATRMHFRASREVRCCSGRYFYRQHAASVSHKVGVRRMDWMKAMTRLRSQLASLGETPDVMQLVEWERWKVIVDCAWFVFRNRRLMSRGQYIYCMAEIRRAWDEIDMSRLPKSEVRKLGYYPFRNQWSLFVSEEVVYFSLKKLFGR